MKNVDARLEVLDPQDLQSVRTPLLGVPHKLINVVRSVRIRLVVNSEVVGLSRLPRERGVSKSRGGKTHRLI